MLNTVSVEKIEKFVETLITEEARQSEDGMKIVFENNEPSCVIMTWDKYKEMMEDQYLIGIVEERLKNGSGKTISHEEMLERLGITQEELDEMEDVEIE